MNPWIFVTVYSGPILMSFFVKVGLVERAVALLSSNPTFRLDCLMGAILTATRSRTQIANFWIGRPPDSKKTQVTASFGSTSDDQKSTGPDENS
jgi:hypothetical protein